MQFERFNAERAERYLCRKRLTGAGGGQNLRPPTDWFGCAFNASLVRYRQIYQKISAPAFQFLSAARCAQVRIAHRQDGRAAEALRRIRRLDER
jgi:hypothetical protein